MAAAHGLQVLYLGFLSNATAYEMGVPSVPLGGFVFRRGLVAL